MIVIGNHDKRNTIGHELFKEYVYNPQVLYPSSNRQTKKQNLFLYRKITKLKENFTDVNFLELLTIDGKRVLFIGIDNNLVRSDYGFVEAVEALPDTTYFVSVPKSNACRLKRPMTITKQYRWGGKTRTKTVVADTESEPITVGELAKNVNDYFWYRCP